MKFAHTYHYQTPSELAGGRLRLATSNDASSAPSPFLRGEATQPRLTALLLRGVSDVVGSRYHIPAAMLERIGAQADPVLTWDGGLLRVEGFSSCCGVYVRADIGPEVVAPSDAQPGTTNVDFNAPMRAALGSVRRGDALSLAVGDDGVSVAAEIAGESVAVVERKVTLPLRWIRGFLESQAVTRRMEQRFELDRTNAARFLRSLPRSGRAGDASYVVATGRSARLSSGPRAGAVRVAGLQRLRTLEPLLSHLTKLVVSADPVTGASAWRAETGGAALTLTLSPETWRGFSGEGQALSDLSAGQDGVAAIRAALRWQPVITAEALASETGLAASSVAQGLSWLASRGLVGWDIAAQSWFHRVLPFALDQATAAIETHQPRLKGARKLLQDGAVTLSKRDDAAGRVSGAIVSGGVTHRVDIVRDDARCTCPWYAKHTNTRGPCKHILATRMRLDDDRRSTS